MSSHSSWSFDLLADFVERNGFKSWASIIKENQIGGDALVQLQWKELIDLGLAPYGELVRLRRLLQPKSLSCSEVHNLLKENGYDEFAQFIQDNALDQEAIVALTREGFIHIGMNPIGRLHTFLSSLATIGVCVRTASNVPFVSYISLDPPSSMSSPSLLSMKSTSSPMRTDSAESEYFDLKPFPASTFDIVKSNAAATILKPFLETYNQSHDHLSDFGENLLNTDQDDYNRLEDDDDSVDPKIAVITDYRHSNSRFQIGLDSATHAHNAAATINKSVQPNSPPCATFKVLPPSECASIPCPDARDAEVENEVYQLSDRISQKEHLCKEILHSRINGSDPSDQVVPELFIENVDKSHNFEEAILESKSHQHTIHTDTIEAESESECDGDDENDVNSKVWVFYKSPSERYRNFTQEFREKQKEIREMLYVGKLAIEFIQGMRNKDHVHYLSDLQYYIGDISISDDAALEKAYKNQQDDSDADVINQSDLGGTTTNGVLYSESGSGSESKYDSESDTEDQQPQTGRQRLIIRPRSTGVLLKALENHLHQPSQSLSILPFSFLPASSSDFQLRSEDNYDCTEEAKCLDDCLEQYRIKWNEEELPKLERDGYRIWTGYGTGKLKTMVVSRWEKERTELESKRIPELRREILSVCKSNAQVKRLAPSMHPSLADLCELNWKLNLLAGPCPPPLTSDPTSVLTHPIGSSVCTNASENLDNKNKDHAIVERQISGQDFIQLLDEDSSETDESFSDNEEWTHSSSLDDFIVPDDEEIDADTEASDNRARDERAVNNTYTNRHASFDLDTGRNDEVTADDNLHEPNFDDVYTVENLPTRRRYVPRTPPPLPVSVTLQQRQESCTPSPSSFQRGIDVNPSGRSPNIRQPPHVGNTDIIDLCSDSDDNHDIDDNISVSMVPSQVTDSATYCSLKISNSYQNQSSVQSLNTGRDTIACRLDNKQSTSCPSSIGLADRLSPIEISDSDEEKAEQVKERSLSSENAPYMLEVSRNESYSDTECDTLEVIESGGSDVDHSLNSDLEENDEGENVYLFTLQEMKDEASVETDEDDANQMEKAAKWKRRGCRASTLIRLLLNDYTPLELHRKMFALQSMAAVRQLSTSSYPINAFIILLNEYITYSKFRNIYNNAISQKSFDTFSKFLRTLDDSNRDGTFPSLSTQSNTSRSQSNKAYTKRKSVNLINDSDNSGVTGNARPIKKPKQKKRLRQKRKRTDGSEDELFSADDKTAERGRQKKKVILEMRQNERQHEFRRKNQEILARAGDNVMGYRSSIPSMIVVNPGHQSDEDDIFIHAAVARQLKPHQIEGVQFMWRNIVMTENGCIIAHSMGLGKSIQTIAFLATVQETVARKKDRDVNIKLPTDLKNGCFLILAPASVVRNWGQEIYKWGIKSLIDCTKIIESRNELDLIRRWSRDGGILVMSHTLLRDYCVREDLCDAKELLLHSTSLIVVDEAHVIKNPDAKLTGILRMCKTRLRVALTGTPIQNNLQEYWSMADFVMPGYLGDLKEFKHLFASVIDNGRHQDSCERDKRKSRAALRGLIETTKDFLQRKGHDLLKKDLPPKHDFIIFLRLSPLQLALYKQYLDATSSDNALARGHCAVHILTHPAVFKLKIDRDFVQSEKKQNFKSVEPGNIEEIDGEQPDCIVPLTLDEENDNENEDTLRHESQPLMSKAWIKSFFDQNPQYDEISASPKIHIALKIIEEARQVGDKVLLFARYLATLDYMQEVLKKKDVTFLRIDGSSTKISREEKVLNFNSTETNRSADVFMISLKSGATGINLHGANRVIIMDYGWNPSDDEQAIARAYRYGQKKSVFVYRLCSFGTYEESLFNKNIFKLHLSMDTIDETTLRKTLTKKELGSYFQIPEDNLNSILDYDSSFREFPDSILQNIIRECRNDIIDCKLHTSLFNEDENEQISEEEERRIREFASNRRQRFMNGEKVELSSFPHLTDSQDMSQEAELPQNRETPIKLASTSFNTTENVESPPVADCLCQAYSFLVTKGMKQGIAPKYDQFKWNQVSLNSEG